jgi:ATP-dependent Lon protease
MEFLPDGTIKQTLEIPPVLALLPIRDLVVFPYMVVPLMVSREMSVAAVDEALATKDRLVLLAAQRDEREDEPAADAIHTFGTVGMIMRMRKLSDGRIKVLVQGLMRARLTGFVQKAPCFTVHVERVEEQAPAPSPETEALMRSVKDDLGKFSQAGKLQSPELMLVLSGVEEPGRLADLVASNVTMKVAIGQALLEELAPVERLRKVGAILRQSSSTWPCASWPRAHEGGRSSASSARRASARPRSASPSPRRWAASSSASPRRRARRGRDPRPPPHLHRLDARPDHRRSCARPARATRS